MYRHDLLVALRVVNSIEKEALQAEWEGWVMEENRRCRQVERLLGGQEENHTDASGLDGSLVTRRELRKWHDDYCGSCKREHGRITQL